MNKQIDFSQPGGFPLHQGVLDFMQSGYADAIKGIANMVGDMIIVSGMIVTGNNVSSGWIVKGGELLPFLGGAKQDNIIIEENSSAVRYQDGQDRTVFFTRQCRFGSGVGQFPYSSLRRIYSNSFTLDAETFATSKALKRLAELSLYEETVIINGCNVSNINTVTGTCTISAGKVLIADQYYETAAYNGAYPVWINSSGQYVTALPDGLSIKFDPFTSQRKADVLRRAVTAPGQIIELATWSDRFDPVTLVGKWEMTGFSLSADDRGRVSVGYDNRTIDPADGVWDANYNGPGNTGGSKSKVLTMENLPAVMPFVFPLYGEVGRGKLAGGNSGFEGNENINAINPGGGQAVDIRQSYIVRVKAIRTQP